MMTRKRSSKNSTVGLTTYERLTKCPVRKAKIEKTYEQLLLSELLLALAEEDYVSVRRLAKAAN
jgi:hypothetical protein